MLTTNNTQYTKNYLNEIKNLELYLNGKKTIIYKDSKEFNNILKNVLKLAPNTRVMPALGVSLHDDTVKALKTSTWLKVNFNKELKINDLPFTALLLRLDDNCSGINLIREYNGRYDGRCIYLSFNKSVNLSEIIK